jgi:site-specific recombinase XerC
MNFPDPNAKIDAAAGWRVVTALASQLQTLASAQIGGRVHVQIQFPKSDPPTPDSISGPVTEIGPVTITIDGMAAEFIRSKQLSGRSQRYIKALGYSLKGFLDCHGKRPPWAVTVQEIEEWLHARGVTARTRCGYLGDLRTFFGFALKRGYVASNPAMAVDMPATAPGAVTVHTPAESQAVLDFARKNDTDICRALAIRYFGGLRTAEVERLTEGLIHDGAIEVPAEKSKTRQRRLVTVQPNLVAWLALGGALPPPKATDRRMIAFTAKLKAETGIVWPHNVTRHSFCSYHLAKFESAGKTALEAGHSETMLFRHYRAVVTKAVAELYFSIQPK